MELTYAIVWIKRNFSLFLILFVCEQSKAYGKYHWNMGEFIPRSALHTNWMPETNSFFVIIWMKCVDVKCERITNSSHCKSLNEFVAIDSMFTVCVCILCLSMLEKRKRNVNYTKDLCKQHSISSPQFFLALFAIVQMAFFRYEKTSIRNKVANIWQKWPSNGNSLLFCYFNLTIFFQLLIRWTHMQMWC